MKLMLLALGVVLLLTVGEALDCHKCLPLPGESSCDSRIVRCSSTQPYCGIKTLKSNPSYQQRDCMTQKDCEQHQFSTYDVRCCQSSHCNN